MARDYILICPSCRKRKFLCSIGVFQSGELGSQDVNDAADFISEHQRHPGGVRAVDEHDPLYDEIGYDD